MSDLSAVSVLPDRSLLVAHPPIVGRRVSLSSSLFVGLPEERHAASLLFSLIDQPGNQAPALEVRCPHPAGLPWMTLEFLCGGDSTAAIRAASAFGLRLRAKALPAMTMHAKCAFATSSGAAILDVQPAIYLTHDFKLMERQIALAGTALQQGDEVYDLRIFLTLPQSTYFAAIISHAELFWT